MLKVKQWTLGSDKAVAKHLQLINNPCCYSLTITLNPYYNILSMADQYNKMRDETIVFFKEMGPYFKEAMINFEFTKDYNVHSHNYIVTNQQPMIFIQNIKHFMNRHKYFGKQYKLHIVDEVTDVLKGYPFKDILQTQSYSEALGGRFNPKHYYVVPTGNIIIVANNDEEVIHNGKTFKTTAIRDYLGMMNYDINELAENI